MISAFLLFSRGNGYKIIIKYRNRKHWRRSRTQGRFATIILFTQESVVRTCLQMYERDVSVYNIVVFTKKRGKTRLVLTPLNDSKRT